MAVIYAGGHIKRKRRASAWKELREMEIYTGSLGLILIHAVFNDVIRLYSTEVHNHFQTLKVVGSSF